jgi:Phosphate-selective porin O and P
MKLLLSFRGWLLALFISGFTQQADAQFLMDMVDTTKDVGKGLLSIYKKFDHIRINGYIQPQFQVAEKKGIKSFDGGDFGAHVNNRFMLRRGRIRFEYAHFNDLNQPTVQFVFQFDGSEKGVFARDFWGRYFENKWQLFTIAGGMFARPFGYELNLASSDRESPERGRMSQTLMKVERDLGAMVSFEPRRKNHPLRYFKLDVGVFNGQGLNAPGEYDSYKDIISRFALKPLHLSKAVTVSAGLSFLEGGIVQPTKYVYHTATNNTNKLFIVDSSVSNIEGKAPRAYRGVDVQVKIKSKWGFTELRAEYWWGRQSSTATNTETPAALLAEPVYVRKFDGAYFYLLQNIVNVHHQVGIKYDWYDPNTAVKKQEIGKPGANFNAADIKFGTLSAGYNYYINENLKLMLWYDMVTNESTSLAGYTSDQRDNVFTCRLQFRF